jgi:hypothetical protein
MLDSVCISSSKSIKLLLAILLEDLASLLINFSSSLSLSGVAANFLLVNT